MAVDVEHRDEQQAPACPAPPGAALFSSASRSARKPASLPSISPAWIPPCTSSTGTPRFFACSAVSAPVRVTASASIGRPSGVRPNSKQRTCFGYAFWKARAQGDDFVVAAGVLEAGAFGDRAEGSGNWRGGGQGKGSGKGKQNGGTYHGQASSKG